MEWIDIKRELPWLGRGSIRLIDQAVEAELSDALVGLGFKIIVLNGAAGSDEPPFFEEMRRGFGFPDYFGKNWDAFHDSFGDLAYRPERRLAVLWRNASITLQANPGLLLKGVHEFLEAGQAIGRIAEPGRDPVQVELFLLGTTPAFNKRPSG